MKRILIVEDAVDLRESLTDYLEDHGYEVATAANGFEALSWLRTTQVLPDAILLDLMMPEMDGQEFRREQAADSKLAAIPVVLMTAFDDAHGKAQALGTRGYLQKPFKRIGTVVEEVERVLQCAETAASAD